jgi:hypothetical protein
MGNNGRQISIVSLVLWAAGVVTGFGLLAIYDATSGRAAGAKTRWPEGTPLTLNPDHPTLVLFAHPQCPCTAATMETLNRALAQASGRAEVMVYFYDDPALGAHWTNSPVWRDAAAIPGVKVYKDELGEMARAFGAFTSGQALLYAPDGKLIYQGGLTPARGQPGDGTVLSTWLIDGTGPSTAPVFGCSLLGPDEQ